MVKFIKEKLSIAKSQLGYYSKKLLEYTPKFLIKSRSHLIAQPRILRVICQRPFFTGSGINLINLIKQSKQAGLKQFIIFGQPAGVNNPLEGIIETENALIVNFKNDECPGIEDIPFPVAGMSDQMPYNSTKFSKFNGEMLEVYLSAFASKINEAFDKFQPNIIHVHHLWIVSALCRVLYPDLPIIATCHNTALRQMVLASQLKVFLFNTIQDIDVIVVQNEDQKNKIKELYQFKDIIENEEKFITIGQGINADIFYSPSPEEKAKEELIQPIKNLIYVGKLSFSKGVPQLIEAFKQVCNEIDIPCQLFIAGSGVGMEKASIMEMTMGLKNKIRFLGQLEQIELSDYFRKSDIFLLPSFYEGLPKVLFESLASGCKAIITDLPGIKRTIENQCGKSNNIIFIPRPKMKSIDKPDEEDLPNFIYNLKIAIKNLLYSIETTKVDYEFSEKIRSAFGWNVLFNKYLKIYKTLIML